MWTVRPHRTSSWPTEGQSDMPTGEQPSVVVIGAGLAGLGAAERLRRNGIASIVLEASERPGGRVRTDSWHQARIELGGMFLVPAYTKLIALAQDLGLGDQIACADEGLALAIHKAGAWRYLDMADPRSVPRSGLVSPGAALRAAIGAAQYLRYFSPKQDWTDLRTMTGPDRRLLTGVFGNGVRDALALLELDTGCSPDEVSAVFAVIAARLAARGTLKRERFMDLMYVKSGVGAITDALAQRHNVRYRFTVDSVAESADGVLVHGTDAAGTPSEIRADHAIIATTADVAGTLWQTAPKAVTDFLRSVRYTQIEGAYFRLDIPFDLRTPGGTLVTQSIIAPSERQPQGIWGCIYQSRYAQKGGLVAVGRGTISGHSEDVLAQQFHDELERLHPELAGHIMDTFVFRRPHYVPVFAPGHIRRFKAASQHATSGRIVLAGDYLRFCILEGALSSGYQAADAVLHDAKGLALVHQ